MAKNSKICYYESSFLHNKKVPAAELYFKSWKIFYDVSLFVMQDSWCMRENTLLLHKGNTLGYVWSDVRYLSNYSLKTFDIYNNAVVSSGQGTK